MTLSGRPLLATKRDAALFVNRESELRILERALKLGLNSLAFGRAGSGKTSLLNALAYRQRENFVFVTRSGEATSTAVDLLQRMRGLGSSATGTPKAFGIGAPPSAARAIRDLSTWVAAQEEKSEGKEVVLVLDGLSVAAGRELFGVLRDELWATGLRWIVSVRPHEARELTQPPVDAFFETQFELEPLTDANVVELINRRGAELGAAEVQEIAATSTGQPRNVLDLVRYAVQNPSESSLSDKWNARDTAVSTLDSSMRALLDQLESHGPMSASNPELSRDLGLTRSRITQMFSELERRGLVTRSTPKTSQPGRPKVVFRSVAPHEYVAPEDLDAS
jgi:predicted transcriptional regulator